MEFFEAPAFTRELYRYLSEDSFAELEILLTSHPEVGDIMPGTGGFRKIRWIDKRRGKGRRGGIRVIYYLFSIDDRIWLFSIFDKNEMTDLSPREKKQLKYAVELEISARRNRRAKQ
jgi:hypothetical protein